MNADHADKVVRVAAIYLASAVKPRARVASTLGMSRATAGRWIATARELGLIPLNPSWTTSDKIERVARSLGCSPSQLKRAVIEHADGDLRVRN
jgi:DNA-binding transcriptional regulator LsrR (DeoR family)